MITLTTNTPDLSTPFADVLNVDTIQDLKDGLWDFDFARLLTLTPLDCPEALDAIDDLRDVSLAMMRDIQRSDAKQPKQLMNELFGV